MFGIKDWKKRILCDSLCGDSRHILQRNHKRGCPYWRQETADKLRRLAEDIDSRRAAGEQ